jgi:hypothetical protein
MIHQTRTKPFTLLNTIDIPKHKLALYLSLRTRNTELYSPVPPVESEREYVRHAEENFGCGMEIKWPLRVEFGEP